MFFVSLEQSRIEIAERLLCCQARVDSHSLRKGTLNAEDMEKLIDGRRTLREAKLFIDDTPAQGMLRIAANARRSSCGTASAGGHRLFAVDRAGQSPRQPAGAGGRRSAGGSSSWPAN